MIYSYRHNNNTMVCTRERRERVIAGKTKSVIFGAPAAPHTFPIQSSISHYFPLEQRKTSKQRRPSPSSISTAKMPPSTHKIENAKSGRSKCKRCKELIANGELRIVTSAYSEVSPGFYFRSASSIFSQCSTLTLTICPSAHGHALH